MVEVEDNAVDLLPHLPVDGVDGGDLPVSLILQQGRQLQVP